MYSECSCNSEFDMMFFEDKENRGLLDQSSQNAETSRGVCALVLTTAVELAVHTEPGDTVHSDHNADGAP